MSKVPALTGPLQLALAFLNTYDLLEDPPDLLTVARLQQIGSRFGQAGLTGSMGQAALPALRRLRGQLYEVFAGETDADKIGALNHVLRTLPAAPRVGPDGADGFRVIMTGPADADPVRAFGLVIADAVTHALVTGGSRRLGICAGTPCRCTFVDRTRAGRQRYCCELCNDRMAAAAYRARATTDSR
jgi:predicted RNA-binding Zn ribbon-like protein